MKYRPSPTSADVTFRKSWRKSQLRVNVVSYVVRICKAVLFSSLFSSDSNTREPNRPQHDRPAKFVIAQQYSSSTLVSLCVSSRKQKFGACQKCYYLIFNGLLKFRTLGIVCNTFLCARGRIGLRCLKGGILVNLFSKMWLFIASLF